ncbi:MAG: hypothetical protein ACREXR_01545 [Gammaproteobacteria bacterium]
MARHIEPSIYKMKDGMLQRAKSSLFMHDMEDDDILISYAAQEGETLHPSAILARILLKYSVVRNGEYGLKPKAVELVEHVREQIIG